MKIMLVYAEKMQSPWGGVKAGCVNGAIWFPGDGCLGVKLWQTTMADQCSPRWKRDWNNRLKRFKEKPLALRMDQGEYNRMGVRECTFFLLLEKVQLLDLDLSWTEKLMFVVQERCTATWIPRNLKLSTRFTMATLMDVPLYEVSQLLQVNVTTVMSSIDFMM